MRLASALRELLGLLLAIMLLPMFVILAAIER